jgi:digeranylgeranylglycerophospholipid reductase
MINKSPDVLIIGGGVSGLSSSIAFARNGLNVLVLEKNNEFGLRIKGEVINKEAEIFKTIFKTNEGLPREIINSSFNTAKYYTPSMNKYALRPFPEGIKVGIEYRKLIDAFCKISIQEGVDLMINSEVRKFIQENDKIIGVEFEQYDQIQKVFPKIIIYAAGINTNLTLPMDLKSPDNICKALKMNMEGVNLSDPNQLEFYLLDIPGVIYIFPKSKTQAEIGFMVWEDQIKDGSKIELIDFFRKKIINHSKLNKILGNAVIIYQSIENLPMSGPMNEISKPNIFLIGDAAGTVGAAGGSGIVSSMTLGYMIGELASKAIKSNKELQDSDFKEIESQIKKSEMWKWLKKESSNAKAMRKFLYGSGDIDNIDIIWDKFKYLIETREA